MTRDRGVGPVAEVAGAAKAGVADPPAVGLRRIVRLFALVLLLATTRSGLPSTLRSARVGDLGFAPAAKETGAAKEGVAAPAAVVFRSTETVPTVSLATTRSGLPSPLR